MDAFTLQAQCFEEIKGLIEKLDASLAEATQGYPKAMGIDEQRQLAAKLDAILEIRASLRIAEEKSRKDPSPERLPIHSPDYLPPSRQHVSDAFRGFTQNQVSQLLGVDKRSVRRWLNGEGTIPHAAWRLYLITTGMVTQTPMKKPDVPSEAEQRQSEAEIG